MPNTQYTYKKVHKRNAKLSGDCEWGLNEALDKCWELGVRVAHVLSVPSTQAGE